MDYRSSPYSIRLVLFILGILALWNYVIGIGIFGMEIIAVALFLFQLFVLDFILRESTIYNTIWFRLLNFCAGICIVGNLFMMMRYPYGDLLLFSGVAGAMLIYLIRTSQKSQPTAADISKCIWFLLFGLSIIFNLFHLRNRELLQWVNFIAFIVMVIIYNTKKRIKKDDPSIPRQLDQV